MLYTKVFDDIIDSINIWICFNELFTESKESNLNQTLKVPIKWMKKKSLRLQCELVQPV